MFGVKGFKASYWQLSEIDPLDSSQTCSQYVFIIKCHATHYRKAYHKINPDGVIGTKIQSTKK